MIQIGLPVMFTFNYNLPYDSALLSRSPNYRPRAEKVLRVSSYAKQAHLPYSALSTVAVDANLNTTRIPDFLGGG